MLQDVGNFVRMLVRPAVTILFVGTLCYLAIAENKEGVLAVASLGGVAVNAWFNDRANKQADPGDK